jgi:hypothetical protein
MSMKRVVLGLVVVLALGLVAAPGHAFLFGNCCACNTQCCAVAPYEVRVSYTPIQPQPGECTYCTCLPYGCPDGAPVVNGCPPGGAGCGVGCAAPAAGCAAPCGGGGGVCGITPIFGAVCGIAQIPCCMVGPVVNGACCLVGGVLQCTCGILSGVLGCICGGCGPCGGAPAAVAAQ